MIVALLNQKGGVGKTTRHPHRRRAGDARQHVVLLDADPQGSALDWTQRRSQQGLLFSAGLARETLHQEAPELARRADHVVIDGPPRIAALARSALLAAERADPVQPSPYDLWASAEMVALIREAQVFRPALRAAFVINRRVSTTVIGREARGALAEQPLPALRAEVHQRIVFADSVAAGRRTRDGGQRRRAKSPRWWMNCCGGRHEQPTSKRTGKRVGIGARPPANPHAEAWIRQGSRCLGRRPLHGRLTLDITPAMRARIKVSAFTQGVTVADLLRGLLERVSERNPDASALPAAARRSTVHAAPRRGLRQCR
jgi:chromosome partitioning protein